MIRSRSTHPVTTFLRRKKARRRETAGDGDSQSASDDVRGEVLHILETLLVDRDLCLVSSSTLVRDPLAFRRGNEKLFCSRPARDAKNCDDVIVFSHARAYLTCGK